ncbi:septation protein SepH [Nocardia sp. alder85J]|uniref:septation protein SepH n=1 Tax=Nocardia sp. alder85J TaxID=2862949 RepID=UPI001CD397D6|nr:septation protein SepH [Nocardia sp. alder85J]MCX4093299.1 septation protein SepH [Nocardia sp. alder85J]
MRELRVIGLTPDSTHIVCIDTETGQKYRLAADEKLRAAARGDLARFGQIEIETEATMRPRDIQARIRAGASVEQVTEESGMPASRVERFAYPVLLERARAAELAQRAHPVRKDGPAVETLIEVVSAAFSERGHNIDIAEWDAWKDERGYWVAQLQWQAGRSVIAAHWRYQPDAHGGSVSPLDDPASDLVDPDFGRALRGLATILPEPAVESGPAEVPAAPAPAPRGEGATAARAAAERSQQGFDEYYEPRAAVGGNTVAVTGAAAAPAAAGGAATSKSAPAAPRQGEPVAPRHPEPAAPQHAGTAAPASQPAAPQQVETAAPQHVSPPPAAPSAPAATAPAQPATPPAPEPAPAPAKSTPAAAKAAPAKAAPKARSKRGGKAPMPSWEDVLLGVRSSGH